MQEPLADTENFGKQVEKTTSQIGSSKASTIPTESKEAREKWEKMEGFLEKAGETTTAKRFSEAVTWLRQAQVLVSSEKQKEISGKMQGVQRQANRESLSGATEEPAPVIPQPQDGMSDQPQPGMQTNIFPEQQAHTMSPEPVMRPVP